MKSGPKQKLHHLALGASDVGQLAEFYSNVLGLREITRHTDPADGALRSVWLELGGDAVLMIERSLLHPSEKTAQIGSGLFLLALTGELDEMKHCRQRLEQSGILPESSREFTQYYRDPEGNRFALSSYEFPSS